MHSLGACRWLFDLLTDETSSSTVTALGGSSPPKAFFCGVSSRSAGRGFAFGSAWAARDRNLSMANS